MKWTYSVKSKVTTSVLLFMVIGLVMYTNFSEQRNSSRISEAISAIYEDRLVVESYIFQYAEYLHQLIDVVDRTGLSYDEKQQHTLSVRKAIENLHLAYSETKLTREEEFNFNKFVGYCTEMDALLATGNFADGKEASKEALGILSTLSTIQVTEGKAQLLSIQKLFSSGHVTAQFEMTILIVVALIIQAMLFASRTLQVSLTSKAELN